MFLLEFIGVFQSEKENRKIVKYENIVIEEYENSEILKY